MMRVTDLDKHDVSDKLLQLEDTISRKFISNITGQPAPGEFLRELFTIPARYGGLGIENPVLTAKEHYEHSVIESAPLTSKIVVQDVFMDGVDSIQKKEKSSIKKEKEDARQQTYNLLLEKADNNYQKRALF